MDGASAAASKMYYETSRAGRLEGARGRVREFSSLLSKLRIASKKLPIRLNSLLFRCWIGFSLAGIRIPARSGRIPGEPRATKKGRIVIPTAL